MNEQKYKRNELGQALFIVNRHAKTAPDPSKLYELKKQAMDKLLKDGLAQKMGLHFSNNPKYSRQHSVLLVNIDQYYFHIPPSKEDMKQLTHLGTLDYQYSNPKPAVSLSKAKRILHDYLNKSEPKNHSSPKSHQKRQKPAASQTLSPFYHKRKQQY
ncbi:hypothetical protein J416_07167 [Gracilibacillus halophilus YIM-C55.5]|uniref:YkyB-like protein n=1 Tax=Gracilibacillus halophilus YIM-C55.5 TaxID=1308866 RepID=N4WVT8_9BACI|nr:YkyB family protein [Gracilibacillus halophilus]ENH97201.1 hypothetical protein J416_07167 [Gracilibacillus halophilus YIM-C55.5]